MADLKAGTSDSIADSMAAAMENAFRAEWPKVMGDDQDVPDPSPEMRLLFVAVAQGVIRHLKDNAQALEVTVGSAATTHDHEGTVTEVNVEGTLY